MQLDLVSEPFSQFGNIGAEGLSRVLGAPAGDRLSILVRESVQNSWDARKRQEEGQLRIRFHFRTLDTAERSAMDQALCERPDDGVCGDAFATYFGSTAGSLVLEISDFGTVGLSGPTSTSAVMPTAGGTNFIDFVRNTGKLHDELGGGTYGFGKASLYSLSRSSTILVDSVTNHSDAFTRRVIFSRIARRFHVAGQSGIQQYTGRHWWGVGNEQVGVEPVEAHSAVALAENLGLPARDMDDTGTGTTIAVLDPDLDGYTVNQAAQRLILNLLLNFWPKMVPNASGGRAVQFEVAVEGKELDIPSIETIPPLNLFARSLRTARAGTQVDGLAEVREILCGSPRAHLGYAAYATDLKRPRRPDLIAADLAPNDGDEPAAVHGGVTTSETNWLTTTVPCHHYALMRPGELVVRYVQGVPAAQDGLEWAGVFITSGEEKIEKAFAKSEPPTHDDWNEGYLSERHEKTFVRVAKRRLREAFRDFVQPPSQAMAGSADISLGEAADGLGRLLPGLTGEAASPPDDSGGSRGTRSGSTRKTKVSRPIFSHFSVIDSQPVAIFSITVTPPQDTEAVITLQAQPLIILDGKAIPAEEVPGGTPAPHIVTFEAIDDTEIHSQGRIAGFKASAPVNLEIAVACSDEMAIGLKVELLERHAG